MPDRSPSPPQPSEARDAGARDGNPQETRPLWGGGLREGAGASARADERAAPFSKRVGGKRGSVEADAGKLKLGLHWAKTLLWYVRSG